MALIHMNCPGCGAALRAREHDYICEYCGSIVLRLPEKDGTVGATGLTADAFRRRLQESSRIFTVRMEQPPESDIDAKILAGKLERAESSLREGKAHAAEELLRGVPDTVFRAARLRFLAETGARDETELSHYAGDITILRHYAEMMAAADSGTRETYGYIAELCRQNVQIQESIRKGHELLQLGQTEAALEYAEQTVERYGMYARAWELLIAARCCASESYNPYADLPYMEACPDAELTVMQYLWENGRVMATRIAEDLMAQYGWKNTGVGKSTYKKMGSEKPSPAPLQEGQDKGSVRQRQTLG